MVRANKSKAFFTINVDFIKAFIVWFIGFVLNVIPLAYNCLLEYLASKGTESKFCFFTAFFSSNEFNFIAFSTIFILVIELLILKIYKDSQLKGVWQMALVMSIYYLIIYFVFTANHDWYNYFNLYSLAVSHIVSIVFTFILAICFIYIQSKE